MWLKEYTFNALLQPLHMMIYYIFVTSAMSFATENIIYVLVVFGFITQAENILKRIFGFEAPFGTVGGLSGGASTAMTLSALTSTASSLKNIFSNPNKSSGGMPDGSYDDGENTSSYEIPDYTRFAGLRNGDTDAGGDELLEENVPDAGGDRGIEFNGELADQYSRIYDNLSQDENDRFNQLISEGYGAEDALTQAKTEGYFGLSGNPLSEDEQNLYNAMRSGDMGAYGAMEQIYNARQANATRRASTMSSATPSDNQNINGTEIPPVSAALDTGAKLTAPKGTFSAIKSMFSRRLNNSRQNIKNSIKPRKIIKGIAKGAALGASMAMATGVVAAQAAVSIAMDGKYNPLEGIATFAGATAAINKLHGKAGNALLGTYQEFQETRLRKDEYKKRKNTKDFLDNKENIKEYQKKYGDMGYAKMSVETARGARLAGKGITNVREQMQVAAYTDSMAEEAFNRIYGNASEEKIHKDAQRIRENAEANGDKNLAKLTDRDIIKTSLRNVKMGNDSMSFEDLAVATLQSRKEIGESIINATKDKQEAYIRSVSGGNKEVAEGMRKAIESNRRMNLANINDKQRIKDLKVEYATHGNDYKNSSNNTTTQRDIHEVEKQRAEAAKVATEARIKKEAAEKAYRKAGRDRSISEQDNRAQKLEAEREMKEAQMRANEAFDAQINAMEEEAKRYAKTTELSSDQGVQDWQMALTALDVANKNGGVLSRQEFKDEITNKYSGALGTGVDAKVENAMKLLYEAGCISSPTTPQNKINLSAKRTEKKLRDHIKKTIRDNS